MRPGWLVLTLAACADRSPRTRAFVAPADIVATEDPVATAPAPPAAPETELPIDPPYAPCPTPGWASAEVLVGAWRTGWSAQKSDQMDGIRHDYEADGTLRMLHMSRRGPPDAKRMHGGNVHYMPRPEGRREMLGTWRIDASGVRERRWVDGATTHVSRGRVWVAVVDGFMPYAKLALRPLERGADGVWRGALYYASTKGQREHGLETQVELRFDPPLGTATTGPCTVEVRTQVRVWGNGKPATWKGRVRDACVIDGKRITIQRSGTPRPPGSEHWPGGGPEHDELLHKGYLAFDVLQLDRVAADVLLAGEPWAEPIYRARATIPPILWHDVIHIGSCAALPAPTD
ncbi:MAG: hypothetical protein H0T76_04765 [Nannocystis sp.]|nr:hypothetical protein [Nannocystis sp.]MBA3545776.1 hypothetical protein [Nannocystis sp.]